MTSNLAFIYALADPRMESPVDAIRYIGMTTTNPVVRLRHHMSEARTTVRIDHRINWLRFLIREGIKPKIIIICSVPESEAFQEEKSQILYHKNLGCDLVNSTDGGEGIINPSIETRKKLSYHARNKSSETRKKISIALTGRVLSEETRRKISISHIGKPSPKITDDGRERIRKAMLGRKHGLGHYLSEEEKRRISERNKGNRSRLGMPHTESTKNKLRLSHSGEKSSSAKLNWGQVREIRSAYSLGNIKMSSLAKQYGVSTGTISPLLKNKTWIDNG